MKSKFGTFGFRVLVFISIFGPIVLVGLVWLSLSSTARDNSPAFYLQLLALAILWLYFVSILLRHAKVICIDTFRYSLETKHILTRRKITYRLGDFTGYIDVLQMAKGGTRRIIYLVQDNQYKLKMTDLIYSNLDELEASLKPLPYIGRKKYTIISGIEGLDDAKAK